MHQIKSGKYVIPASVSGGCADLIRHMLHPNPTARIKPGQILAHSWMKLAPSRGRTSERSMLPHLSPGNTLWSWLRSRERVREPGEVISPFEEDGGEHLEPIVPTRPVSTRKRFTQSTPLMIPSPPATAEARSPRRRFPRN
jgi:serine/threonine protein kinase